MKYISNISPDTRSEKIWMSIIFIFKDWLKRLFSVIFNDHINSDLSLLMNIFFLKQNLFQYWSKWQTFRFFSRWTIDHFSLNRQYQITSAEDNADTNRFTLCSYPRKCFYRWIVSLTVTIIVLHTRKMMQTTIKSWGTLWKNKIETMYSKVQEKRLSVYLWYVNRHTPNPKLLVLRYWLWHSFGIEVLILIKFWFL
jgi:hypothetical protein